MKRLRITLIALVVVSYLSLSYIKMYGWWFSFVGTLLIIVFSYFAWPNHALERIGLKLNKAQIFLSIGGFFVFLFGSYQLLLFIGEINNVKFVIGAPRIFIHEFFYTLNEEMITGALILLYLRRKHPQLSPIYISTAVALGLAISHYILYRWVFVLPAQGVLSAATLFSLFSIGILRNNLILKTGHIGYTWALHFAWIAIMLGCDHLQIARSEYLSQPARFNLFLGDTITVTISAILALFSLVLHVCPVETGPKRAQVIEKPD